jgi:hypothetical protein
MAIEKQFIDHTGTFTDVFGSVIAHFSTHAAFKLRDSANAEFLL